MRRTALSLTLFAVTATALVGCSAIAHAMHHEIDATYPDTQALGNWVGDAPWLPDDATDIRVHSSTNGMVSVVRATSASKLDGCTQVDRQSLWAFAPGWEPAAPPDRAWACGSWDVVPTGDGYFAWSPNDPDEQAASER